MATTASNDSAMLTISDLPPEVLMGIFSYLEIHDLRRVALTCKHFKDLAYSKSLWKDAIFELPLQTGIDKAIVPSLDKRGIRHLYVSVSNKEHLEGVMHNFPRLESLTLSTAHMTKQNKFNVLKLVYMGFTSLRRLTLKFNNAEFLNDDTVDEFATCLPELEDFYWSTGYNLCMAPPELWPKKFPVTCLGLGILFSKLKNLRKFTFMDRNFIKIRSLDCGSESLQHLCLYDVDLSGEAMEILCSSFPNLSCLEIYNASGMDRDLQPVELSMLFAKLKNLKKFTFSFYDYLVIGIFNCRSENMEHLCLKHVDLSTRVMMTICNALPNLICLEFCRVNYSNHDLKGLSLLKNLRKFTFEATDLLTSINLECRLESVDHLCLKCVEFNVRTMKTIYNGFPNIRYLDLELAKYTDRDSAELDMLFTKLKRLKHLSLMFNLYPCKFEKFFTMSSLNYGLDSLMHLCLKRACFNRKTLETIQRAFPKLNYLELERCEFTGDDFAWCCLAFLSHLQDLKVFNCVNVWKTQTDIVAKKVRDGVVHFRFECTHHTYVLVDY